MKKLLNGFFLLGFCFVILLSACDSVYADTVIKPDSIVKVHDGDTFSVNIAGCPAVLCQHVPVRISGIDAPEMKGKCAQETAGAIAAKNYLTEMVMHSQGIALRDPTRDKYFRPNAHVMAGGVDVGADMVARGIGASVQRGQASRLVWRYRSTN